MLGKELTPLDVLGKADNIDSQEPDIATNARAVPIYATTVTRRNCFLPPSWTDSFRASLSMTPRMERGCSVSRSLEISTAGS